MTVSRRDLLALLLGAPLAAQACRRSPGEVPGSLRGQRMAVGHRLRDTSSQGAASPKRHLPVAIVGAGVSGLTAAWRLARAGMSDFVVFDVGESAGGTSVAGTDGVAPYPWGAHYLPLPRRDNPGLLAFLEEAGAVDIGVEGEPRARDLTLVRAPQERIYCGGSWHEGLFPRALADAEDLAQLRRFHEATDRWVAWRDRRGRRAFTLPVRQCSDDIEVTRLDRMSAARWLDEHGFDSPRLRWYVEYGCRDDYGTTLETTSAWAMLYYFTARVPDPGVESAPYLTWPEGNGRLVHQLLRSLPTSVRTSHLVTEVASEGRRVELSATNVRTNERLRYSVSQVILAVPRFVVGRLLGAWRYRPPAWLSDFTYSSWLVANLHVRRRPTDAQGGLAWDNVIYDSPSLGYVVATHQLLRDYGPTILTYYYALTDAEPRRARHQLASLDHASACDVVLGDLGRVHPDLEGLIDRIDVWRWGHAMVRPVPGFVWGDARRAAALPLGRVHFCHSDLSGMGLFEEAFDRGVLAAEAVLRALGHPTEPLGG